MRLIDQIWTKIVSTETTDPLGELTHLSLSIHGAKELLNDYKEEFDETEATLGDLQDYFGLKILIEASQEWSQGEKYELLKKSK